jgi:hypothetical protein
VKNKSLNALCQYYHYSFFENLVSNQKKLEKLMLDFFEKTKSLYPIDSMVLDFAVDLDNEKVYVLEINVCSSSLTNISISLLMIMKGVEPVLLCLTGKLIEK